MREITLKEWSAYLPYGLKGELQFDKSEDFELQDWAIDLSKFKKGTIWKLCGYADTDLHIPLGEGEFNGWLWRNEYTYVNFHFGIKPVLRDLSDLTKEIEHNGEKFVPIHRLLENSNFDLSKMDDDYINSFAESMIEIAPTYDDVQALLSWHFNFFQIPDELIVRVTEDFNPYK